MRRLIAGAGAMLVLLGWALTPSARTLRAAGELSMDKIASEHGVSRATLYRHLDPGANRRKLPSPD